MQKKWDLFISYASEDKNDIVHPLAISLKNRGLKVWYDEFTLKAGKSIRKSIDEGLANSTYGIIILSHNFFNKKWPERELGGLFSKHEIAQGSLIPIWHKITYDEIAEYSPMLADIKAIKTENGIVYVTEQVYQCLDQTKLIKYKEEFRKKLQVNDELLDNTFIKYRKSRDQRERYFIVEHINELLKIRRKLLQIIGEELTDDPIGMLNGKVVSSKSILVSKRYDDPMRFADVDIMEGQFCDSCNKFVTYTQKIENYANLCTNCMVDYQVAWRPEHSPISPNILGYIKWKKKNRKD